MSKSQNIDKELDCTNCGRGVWLVKVPKYIKEKWAETPANAEVGRLKVSRVPNSKVPSVSFSLNENNKLPKEHKFLIGNKETLLGIFSQTSTSSENTENEKVFMEGHVIQKFECQPVVDKNYFQLKKEALQKIEEPRRKTIGLTQPAPTAKPVSFPQYMVRKKQTNEGKKTRDDRDKVQEMLFAAFEKHQYYNIKDLVKITNQPITYLKEILKEVCDYNVKNPHKNMWELKPEYRHYKGDKKQDDNSD